MAKLLNKLYEESLKKLLMAFDLFLTASVLKELLQYQPQANRKTQLIWVKGVRLVPNCHNFRAHCCQTGVAKAKPASVRPLITIGPGSLVWREHTAFWGTLQVRI